MQQPVVSDEEKREFQEHQQRLQQPHIGTQQRILCGIIILMFGFSACQEELAGCSPMTAMMSPALCESAHLERATKYPVSVGAAQRPATVGCKRKARRDQATPDSTAAPLSDCLNQSGRPSGADSLGFRWVFYCVACLHKILRSFVM